MRYVDAIERAHGKPVGIVIGVCHTGLAFVLAPSIGDSWTFRIRGVADETSPQDIDRTRGPSFTRCGSLPARGDVQVFFGYVPWLSTLSYRFSRRWRSQTFDPPCFTAEPAAHSLIVG